MKRFAAVGTARFAFVILFVRAASVCAESLVYAWTIFNQSYESLFAETPLRASFVTDGIGIIASRLASSSAGAVFLVWSAAI